MSDAYRSGQPQAGLGRPLDEADARLVAAIDQTFEEGARRAGATRRPADAISTPGARSAVGHSVHRFASATSCSRRAIVVRRSAHDEGHIETCRVVIDAVGAEAELLDEIEASEGRAGETIVALALAGGRVGD